jgi:hypothetical protein
MTQNHIEASIHMDLAVNKDVMQKYTEAQPGSRRNGILMSEQH